MNTFNHNSGQYLAVNGAKIYYEEIGSRGKPVLLMLHGGFQSIESLNPIAAYLSDDFRIIGIDSRGHGKSTLGSEKMTYEQLQSDIEAVLKHLEISTISILGFSDGGIVAYRIAARNSVKVESLITIGSSWSEQDVLEAEPLLNSITPESAKQVFFDEYELYQSLNPEPKFDVFCRSVVEMWLDRTKTGHPNERVKDISAKTLLVRGDNDFLVSLESLVKLKSIIHDSSFMNIPFAEHTVYEEQPKLLEIALINFLSR